MNALLDELEQNEGGEPVGTSNAFARVGHARLGSTWDALPISWRFLESREGETWSWPENTEEYDPFDVFEGRAANGESSLYAIGRCDRAEVWGRDRSYLIVFRLGSGGGSKQPIAEFLEADDYDETKDFVAIIRGNGGPRGQRMFDPADDLPEPYAGMRIETYLDRIGMGAPGVWNKLAIVAREDDSESMLRHAAIQVHLRHL